MKTSPKDRRAEMIEEHEKALRELDQEEALRAFLPSGFPWSIHWYSLYGTTGTAAVNHDFYDYTRKKAPVTMETVEALADLLPPAPLRMIRDSCLSFQPAAYVDGLPEAKKERWTSETDVAPFTVKISGFQQRTAKFEWNTETPLGLVGVDVTIPLPASLGSLDIRYKNFMGGKQVDVCRFSPSQAAQTVFRGDEPLAQLESPIKWASGSPETPNDHTLYWVHLRDDMTATAADLVRTLRGAKPAA